MKPPTASGKGRDSPGASAPDYTDGEVPDPPPTKVSSQAASRITWDLIGRAQGHREVDRPAIQVADFNIPGIHHRGDFTEDTPKQVEGDRPRRQVHGHLHGRRRRAETSQGLETERGDMATGDTRST